MKRVFILLFIILLLPNTFLSYTASAKESSEEISLESEVDKLIDNIDLTELEKYIETLPSEIIGNASLKDRLLQMLKGQTPTDFSSISNYILNVFFNGIKQKIPTLVTIFCLLIVCAIVNSIKPNRLGNGVYEITFFACYSIIVIKSEAKRS